MFWRQRGEESELTLWLSTLDWTTTIKFEHLSRSLRFEWMIRIEFVPTHTSTCARINSRLRTHKTSLRYESREPHPNPKHSSEHENINSLGGNNQIGLIGWDVKVNRIGMGQGSIHHRRMSVRLWLKSIRWNGASIVTAIDRAHLVSAKEDTNQAIDIKLEWLSRHSSSPCTRSIREPIEVHPVRSYGNPWWCISHSRVIERTNLGELAGMLIKVEQGDRPSIACEKKQMSLCSDILKKQKNPGWGSYLPPTSMV